MLHDFLKTNRLELIERCRAKVANRRATGGPASELEYGVPLFLDQLADMLPGGANAEGMKGLVPDVAQMLALSKIEEGAVQHGEEMLRHRFTIEQVVHDYGDLCQAITQLAAERGVPITAEEFGTLNIRLDNAIAGAVTAFSHGPDADAVPAEPPQGLYTIAHEMRNAHATIALAVTAMERGTVGFGGATSAALKASLLRMNQLVDRILVMSGSAQR